MNITVRVAEDHGRDRDHADVTGWEVSADGSLWIHSAAGNEAAYAHGTWRWVERFPTASGRGDR